MMKISTIIFCVFLALAAAGRYKAEAGVRADKADIRAMEREIRDEKAAIEELRLQVEVLESQPRLTDLARRYTDLEPIRPEQLKTARDFAGLISDDPSAVQSLDPKPANTELITNAIAFADFGVAP